jgi:Protein of unknown function (DUF1587)./Protein of unknown function (DUF1592)./Protein of unknown function (DUF1595)./Protein of unknown function (DUF1588)./Protein of unknown function (DUF1585).
MRVRCPHCDIRFQVSDQHAGKTGRCPNPECRKIIRVPSNPASKSPATPDEHAPPEVPAAPKVPARRKTSIVETSRKTSSSRRPIVLLAACVGAVVILGLVWTIQLGRSSAGLENTAVAAGAPDLERDTSETVEVAVIEPIPAASYEKDLLPFVQKYCSDCHGSDEPEGDFAIDRYTNLASILNDRQVWSKVLKLIELGAMPPSSAEQPSVEERNAAVAWLDHQLFYVDCNQPQDPGRVTVRRLNKTEYNNTVNALLGIDFKPAENFPSDDVGHGFDNIGDVLTVPPLLIEKYLAAAESIAEATLKKKSPVYVEAPFSQDRVQLSGGVQANESRLVFVSHGKATLTLKFPRQGEYLLRLAARQDRGGNEPAKMEIRVDNKPIKTIEVPNYRSPADFSFPLTLDAGEHSISIAFINDFYDLNQKQGFRDRNLHVSKASIEGPAEMTDEDRLQMPLIKYVPNQNRTAEDAARMNLAAFLPRAFRRPVTDDEIAKYAQLVKLAMDQEGTFEEGMGVALQAILVSPDFLFRVEGGRRIENNVEMLDDYALASRLSYFLWSSSPDDELMELAAANRLHEPDVLKEQTLRMLQDPRSDQLIENFAGQWLGLRKLVTSEVDPNPKLFPGFNEKIRLALWKETELYFGSIVREDRSIFDLLTARYTYLNEDLAKFYGIEGVTGPEFRRVDLKDDSHRIGLLTHGSVLTLTSYPNRTSPVKRGEWVLSVLMGDEPPPPPPVVPGLEQTSTANPKLSLRESLELHRADPGCASCHKTMDAIGFGLENFDAVGRWRTEDRGMPIDASGVLPGGESFNGPEELVGVLMEKRDQFARCFVEKLMTYAIGRGIEWYDRCTIDSILAELESNDRFSTVVLEIVQSAPFQSRRPHPTPTADNPQTIIQ